MSIKRRPFLSKSWKEALWHKRHKGKRKECSSCERSVCGSDRNKKRGKRDNLLYLPNNPNFTLKISCSLKPLWMVNWWQFYIWGSSWFYVIYVWNWWVSCTRLLCCPLFLVLELGGFMLRGTDSPLLRCTTSHKCKTICKTRLNPL